MPLLWAHAEYIKLLRSAADETVYESVPEVVERYQRPNRAPATHMVWSFGHPEHVCRPGEAVRLVANTAFEVRWSCDGWLSVFSIQSAPSRLGVHFADLKDVKAESKSIVFTFYWADSARWEGANFTIEITDLRAGADARSGGGSDSDKQPEKR